MLSDLQIFSGKVHYPDPPHAQSLFLFPIVFGIKVALNEVENASFAQRSAHRDSRIWRPELIEPPAERNRHGARTTTDVQIGLPRPTDFATVQYFVQLPHIMFGFSESADIGLSF